MIQGEFTFTYQLVSLLKKHKYKVVASCSNRMVEENHENGKTYKKVVFKFERFREY